MQAKRTPQWARLPGPSISVGASATNTPVSSNFFIKDALHLRVDILVLSAVVGAGVGLKLQTSPGPLLDGTEVWTDVKTATLSADVVTPTYTTIRLLVEVAADQPFLPLGETCRVVATTPAAASVVVGPVRVLS